MTKADEAITYLLTRIQIDPDLLYLMIDTQAHALLMEAEAERTGQTYAMVREARQKDRQPEYRRRGPRIPQFKKLREVCRDLLEYWDHGTPVHPSAEVVAELRAAMRDD